MVDNDHVFKVFARRYPRIVFQHNNGNSGIYNGKDFLPLAYFSGLNIMPYECGIQPSISITGVSFYPYAIKQLFGIDAYELLNELPEVNFLLPKSFTEKMIDTKEKNKRIQLLIDYFNDKVDQIKKYDAFNEIVWETFQNEIKESNVHSFLKKFKISERQLERRFKNNIGLTPNQFLRINRFEKSIQLIKESNVLSDIVFKLNYSDQSHFCRDFKEFSQFTPTQFMKLNVLLEENSSVILKK
ncbi:AraC family transcriptional regulator [Mariniflexile gromovii]|uniref:AraC family transcriptional regulator n=2 Tax=Mariniflexile gromovii TaxID=362523 RepID=A0ABS4BWS3_9FLAO|nr:helix-turn-helix domain-containing protein [Mariniflexile gromovii]MBP0905039.1 AraC family transcriptional regulator [Mariniflexile gromovii]